MARSLTGPQGCEPAWPLQAPLPDHAFWGKHPLRCPPLHVGRPPWVHLSPGYPSPMRMSGCAHPCPGRLSGCVRAGIPEFVLLSVQPGNQGSQIIQPQAQTWGLAALGLCTQVFSRQPDLLSGAAPSEDLWGHPHARHSQAPAPIPVGPKEPSGQGGLLTSTWSPPSALSLCSVLGRHPVTCLSCTPPGFASAFPQEDLPSCRGWGLFLSSAGTQVAHWKFPGAAVEWDKSTRGWRPYGGVDMRVHSRTVVSGQRWEHPNVHQQVNNTMCLLQPKNVTVNESQTKGQICGCTCVKCAERQVCRQTWTRRMRAGGHCKRLLPGTGPFVG